MAKSQQSEITFWLVILAMLVLAVPAASLNGQEQKPKIEPDDVVLVETNLVQLQAVVTDRSGRAVDKFVFEVLENGRPQKINFFSLERIGGESSSARPPDQSIVTPESQKPGPKNPARSIVIFVDYDPVAKDAAATAQMKVEVLRGEAPVYEGPWQPLGSRSIRSDKTGVEAGGEITLGVEPGVYTLRVTVKDVKSNKSTQQTVDFELD
jgi:hypothetical protein